MKTCSPSLPIKEIQINTTLRFYFTPVKIAPIKNTINNKHWQRYVKKKLTYIAGKDVNQYNHYGKQYGGFLIN
jgi:hypothetical protein